MAHFNLPKAASGSLDALSQYLMNKSGQKREDADDEENKRRWEAMFGQRQDEGKAAHERWLYEARQREKANELREEENKYRGPETPQNFESAILEALQSGDTEMLKQLIEAKQGTFKETPEKSPFGQPQTFGEYQGDLLGGIQGTEDRWRREQGPGYQGRPYQDEGLTLDDYLAKQTQPDYRLQTEPILNRAAQESPEYVPGLVLSLIHI